MTTPASSIVTTGTSAASIRSSASEVSCSKVSAVFSSMVSSAPDSSPTWIICSASRGKRLPRAKANLAKAQVQTLAEKVQQYEMDTGTLPDSLAALVSSDAPGWLGPYAKDAELKDPWNHAFEYRVPGADQPFDLVSYGKDGQAGGTSVDADIAFQ